MKHFCLFLLIIGLFFVKSEPLTLLEEFMKANNIFAVSFFKEFLRYNFFYGNFVISPYSTQTLLSLIQSGSNDKAGEEIRKVLHFSISQDQIESAVKRSYDLLKEDDQYGLEMINKMYIDDNFTISDTFQTLGKVIYHADVENVNFTTSATAEEINSKVKYQTHSKIEIIVKPDMFNRKTLSLPISVINFSGRWQQKFSPGRTEDTVFYRLNGENILIDMMHLKMTDVNYYENWELDAKFLELPFLGEGASMVIIVPNEVNGYYVLQQHLDKVFASQNYIKEKVHVALPKFKIESHLVLSSNFFKLMGIHKIFNWWEVDLSKIAGKKTEVTIDHVVEKAVIDVGEEGVNVPDGITITGDTVKDEPDDFEAKEFIVDRPFLFYVKVKNFIILEGKFSDPIQPIV